MGERAERKDSLRVKVFAWLDAHDVSGTPVHDRIACMVEEFGAHRVTIAHWERLWRAERGDEAPRSKHGCVSTNDGSHYDAIRMQVREWCETHDLSGLRIGERAKTCAADLGISLSTASRWEREWRIETGNTPPGPRTGLHPTKMLAKVAARKQADAKQGPAQAANGGLPAGLPASLSAADMGDLVAVPARYLQALEACVYLTRKLKESRP